MTWAVDQQSVRKIGCRRPKAPATWLLSIGRLQATRPLQKVRVAHDAHAAPQRQRRYQARTRPEEVFTLCGGRELDLSPRQAEGEREPTRVDPLSGRREHQQQASSPGGEAKRVDLLTSL